MSKTIGTVGFIVADDKVLLAEIEYPDGKRLWNGIGGVIEDGESPEQAVVREIGEETKLIVRQEDVLEATAINIGDLELLVLIITKCSGELETIDPTLKQLRWFSIDSVPYDQMHSGNNEWLPKILKANN